MARRKTYTKVNKTNQIRADHVKGMGDVVFKGFQGLNSECQEFIFGRKDELGIDFEITCLASSNSSASFHLSAILNWRI